MILSEKAALIGMCLGRQKKSDFLFFFFVRLKRFLVESKFFVNVSLVAIHAISRLLHVFSPGPWASSRTLKTRPLDSLPSSGHFRHNNSVWSTHHPEVRVKPYERVTKVRYFKRVHWLAMVFSRNSRVACRIVPCSHARGRCNVRLTSNSSSDSPFSTGHFVNETRKH